MTGQAIAVEAVLDEAKRQRKLRALARALGVDPSIPQLWASGKRSVPPHRIPAVLAALAEQGVEAPIRAEDGPRPVAPRRPRRRRTAKAVPPQPVEAAPPPVGSVAAIMAREKPLLHALAVELVRAEGDPERRERLLGWRFAVLRGESTDVHLIPCRRCGVLVVSSPRANVPRTTCSGACRAAVSLRERSARAHERRKRPGWHGRERCTGEGCRRCRAGVSLREAYASGRRGKARGPYHSWTPEEEALLRAYGGVEPLPAIVERINAIAVRPRTEAGVSIRAKELGVSVQWQRSMSETARLLGASWFAVRLWIGRGWLQAQPWRRMGRHVLMNISDADLDTFIRAYPWLVDPARMAPGRWRSLAEVERRREPCLTLTEAAKALGYRTAQGLQDWRRRGLVPTVEYIGPASREGRVVPLVRARAIPAIRDAIEAARAESQPLRAAHAATLWRHRWRPTEAAA